MSTHSYKKGLEHGSKGRTYTPGPVFGESEPDAADRKRGIEDGLRIHQEQEARKKSDGK